MWGLRNLVVFVFALAAGLAVFNPPLRAQERALPYWASLRYDEVRMRVGPSGEYPVDWIYKRKGLPVKVVRVREGWRLVEDPDGARGWIARSQLDPARGAMVVGTGLADVRAEPSSASALNWRAQPGVVASLLRCRESWCEVDIAGRKGWTLRERLWGAEDLPGDK
ncbi:MAG: SH3 domain-containing protein [Erythrobacter sp.]|nr:SH3 domain-containing protein [Erythrobacter sp.]